MEFKIKIVGVLPLLMHSARLSDPLHPTTQALKKVTSKRIKTDDDHREVARLEHGGSLYLDEEFGPYLPGENIQRCMIDGAKLSRAGQKVTRGVFISSDINPLVYRGPRTVDTLWADENFRRSDSVKVGTARVMRCRPQFKEWATEAVGTLDTTQLSFEDFCDIADTAGRLIGLGDWRPRFGRFTATVSKV